MSQFLHSVPPAAQAHDAVSPTYLPAAAAAAFVSEISASDFVSVGSSAGGSIFAAIADVDVKVAALNECVVHPSGLSVYLVHHVSPSYLSFFNMLF
jgi:hypothetical protein